MNRLVFLGVLLCLPLPLRGNPPESAADDPANRKPVQIQGRQQAPEFADVEKWLNSEPLTMKKLKGKVVVVHFFAFSCINCKHNYPWYKKTWEEFKDRKDFMMIGIHTPELEEEKVVGNLEKSLKNEGLAFPVAVDGKATMWKRYNNNWWPTVYIIDKQGIARWAWASELGWK